MILGNDAIVSSRKLPLAIFASILMHMGVIVFIGASAGAKSERVTASVLDVQLPVLSGDSYLPQTGKSPIETMRLPMAADRNGQEKVMESFGRGMEQSLPDTMPAKKSSTRPITQSGTISEASDNTLMDADMQLPVRYHDENDLDTPPKPLTPVLTEFPDKAMAANVRGSVALAVFIDVDGVVNKVDVLRADPPGYFEVSAINAVKAVRFSPGWKAGRTVNCRIELSINYGVVINQQSLSGESVGQSAEKF